MKKILFIIAACATISLAAKETYNFEKDFFVDHPDQEKFQKHAYSILNERIQRDMHEIDLNNLEDLKTRPLYQIEAKKAGITPRAEDLCNIYVAGRDPNDQNFFNTLKKNYSSLFWNTINLTPLFNATDTSMLVAINKYSIIISNNSNSLRQMDTNLKNEFVRAFINAEFTSVEQNLDEKILDKASNEVDFGQHVTKAMHIYLDALVHGSGPCWWLPNKLVHGSTEVPHKNKKLHDYYFQRQYQGPNNNILAIAESRVSAIKYANNLELLRDYWKHGLAGPAASPFKYFVDLAELEIQRRQKAN